MQNIFSYPLIVEDISPQEKKYTLKASKEDLAYLKEALKIPDVKSFEAVIFTKLHKKEHRLEVWGKIKTCLELQSVVSLDYFSKSYEPEFKLNFNTKMSYKEQKELEKTGMENIPDIIINGKIDLVDIAIEQIALNIEDYPRKAGETFVYKQEFDPNSDRKNPFEVLAKLKK